MEVSIDRFKSIEHVSIELAPLTLLLGPPASGKSNILDAIALAGYFERIALLSSEYQGKTINLEPLNLIARFDNYQQLFRNQDLTKDVAVRISWGENEFELNLSVKEGKPVVELKMGKISFKTRYVAKGLLTDLNEFVGGLHKEHVVGARLYGYDRYALSSASSTHPGTYGFHKYLAEFGGRDTPENVLSELGWNAKKLARRVHDIVSRLNSVLRKEINERVELKILRSGALAVFDYDVEVDISSVSDSIFRALYYLMAIRTVANYVKLHGLEGRFIILLEEPEAHIFPYFIGLLRDYITRYFVESGRGNGAYAVITTHNPLLISALWDKAAEGSIRTYYVYRDEEGATSVAELDIEKLASELVTAEDILLTPTRDVLENYVVRGGAT